MSAKKSYFATESGAEDAVYRVIRGKKYSAEEVVNLDGAFATTTIVAAGNGVTVESMGNASKNVRKTKEILSSASGVSFHYGVQVGNGGITMDQSSMVTGNIYSNGTISSSNSNVVTGDIISAGPSGSVSGAEVFGSVYSHSISDSVISGDAYYQIIDGVTKVGPDRKACLNPYCYPGSDDQFLQDLPISDDMIEMWKTAASSTVISSPCPYEIDSDATLGPAKINCDLVIDGGAKVTLLGPVWVNGNITVRISGTVVCVDPSLGNQSIAMIADKVSNRLTRSKISLNNAVSFEGSGYSKSYILMVSQNNSAENGGSENAISVEQIVSGKLLLYAGHGKVNLNNRSDLKEVSGYKINLSNRANVIYESGLASLLFSSGPSGGYSIDFWREVK